MALIVDPDDLNQSTEVTFDTAAKTITLNQAGNLSTDGVTLKALYSFCKEEWKNDAALIPFEFPFVPITDESFELVDGWDFANDASRYLIRTAGWAVKNTSGNVTQQWSGIIGLGSIEANDQPYFPTPAGYDNTKGLFGGTQMPEGVTDLIDFEDTSFSAAVTTGDIQYTAANGSYDLTQCKVGDLVKIRFSFNTIPQVQDSQLEVGLIFATRDANDQPTFTFTLTAQPISYPLVGKTFLNRVELSAYIASEEDVNARLLPAIRCNNEILVQPLSTLISVVR